MTFQEHDHVLILKNNIPGEIIDVSVGSDGITRYLVESDIEGYLDGPDVQIPGLWPIYKCTAEELKKI